MMRSGQGMFESIRSFPSQFAFRPLIKNARNFRPSRKMIVAGMGGSALAGDLLTRLDPSLDVLVHRNYGLPAIPESELKDRLIVLDSYSGNTEEVLDAYRTAKKARLRMIAISVGGALIEEARRAGIPYIELPNTGIQPRMALGFSVTALFAAVGARGARTRLARLSRVLSSDGAEKIGRELARAIGGRMPLIYASDTNRGLAYIWKIKINETAKIPAFFNVVPELNHNEMTGFDCAPKASRFPELFHAIILVDGDDHPRIRKRMEALHELYRERNVETLMLSLEGKDVPKKIFSNVLLADWTAFALAERYGSEPDAVPMIEQFKKKIR